MNSDFTSLALAVVPILVFIVILWFLIRREGGVRQVYLNGRNSNIFTNPSGWAQKLIGSRGRYRLMQALAIFQGIALIVMIILLVSTARRGVWPSTLSLIVVSVMVFVSTVEFPLFYLRALRHFVNRAPTAAESLRNLT
jgi:hypothetical protein